jgi:hypothetical protein
VGKFSKGVDILSSSCRIYVLFVMTKAGNFFEDNTPEYETYKRLLINNFGIKVEDRGFRVDDFVKEKGAEVVDKTALTKMAVLKHAKDYGVEAPIENWK